ncbi:MAG: hypothetical protein JSW11_00870 [Candidatus Heimdallarchaeota archaeon]|nr:MAG: hypothetical protein JSW11_00870 [Candidatus Heimdallarchaeota archaeon]
MHEFIRTCDISDLAAIYEYAFGNTWYHVVKKCEESTDEDCLIIEYYDGLEEYED